MRLLSLALLTLLSLPVCAQAAQTVNYSWVAPNTRQDGTALLLSDIAGYEISYSVDNGAPVIVSVKPGTILTTSTSLNLPARSAPYVLKSQILAIDTNGLKSAYSPAVTNNITVLPSNPSAPTSLKITVTCIGGGCSLIIN